MEKTELDFENPIFVHYVNVDNMSRQSADELLYHYSKMVNGYTNVTNWVIATNYCKVECVYDGKSRMRDLEISHLMKEINKRIDILSNSNSFEDFKVKVRDWRLSELVNEQQEE